MALAGTTQPASITYRDAGNEISSFKINGAVLDDTNFVAQEALFATVVTKANALVLGSMTANRYASEERFTTTQPTNGANREIKLLVQGQNTVTGRRLTATLPTLNPATPHYVVNINAKDVVLLTEPTAITDFITAVNAFWLDPVDSEIVEVVGLKVVGRNN